MTNCVYIFGNGFDIRMCMPTSYPDFLKYYQNIKTPNDSIISIKEMFLSKVKEERGEHWKDLEIAYKQILNNVIKKIEITTHVTILLIIADSVFSL